jgi:SAM-dependent methyltransferase
MAATDSSGKRDRSASGRHTVPSERNPVVVSWGDLPHLIREFGDLKPQDRLLVAPCAEGAVAFEAARHCSYVVGVDTREAMIASAAERAVEDGIDNISFRVGNVEHLESSNEMFDRVICLDGLRRFADPAAGVHEFARVLRAPGYLILVDIDPPENRTWRETLDRIEHSRDGSHVSLLTRDQVRSLLEGCDLTIEHETVWQVRRSFDEWIAEVPLDDGAIERTRRLLIEANQKRSTGLRIAVKGKAVEIVHRLTAFVAIKLT